jgi:hypothetical protein
VNRGERIWEVVDGREVPCVVLTGWGEGVGVVIASWRRLTDGQRFLWLLGEGVKAVPG